MNPDQRSRNRSGFRRAVGDLVLGLQCAGCGRPGESLCAECEAALDGTPRLAHPSPRPPGLPAVWAIAPYDGRVRELIVSHKERARLSLSRPLGRALGRAVIAAATDGNATQSTQSTQPLVLVAVPSSRRAVCSRGHDATARLARAAAMSLRRQGRSVIVRSVLRQRRLVADQAGLDAGERWRNLAGSLDTEPTAARALRGRLVVVVDDVVTTGATLAAATSALRSIPDVTCVAAVVAATRRRHESAFTGGTD